MEQLVRPFPVPAVQGQMAGSPVSAAAYRQSGRHRGRGGRQLRDGPADRRYHQVCSHGADIAADYLHLPVCSEVFRPGYDDWFG
ncbi:hypothetical protein D3C81_2178520 [compost metagenome]